MPAAIPIALAASAGISAIASNSASNKAVAAAREAGQASQIDINALDQKTRDMALKNAHDSAALEQQMTPEVPALREAANRGVFNQIGQNDTEAAYKALLTHQLGQPVAGNLHVPLLDAAIARAQGDLSLGGQLPQDVRNLVMRQALSNGGSVANGMNLGLGRDMSVRDLGLTSLQLANQRLSNAGQLGQQEAGVAQFDTGTAFNNASNNINRIQLLRAIGQDQFGRSLAGAQYGESIQRPVVGLDPGSVADIYSGNANNRGAALSNMANIYGAQGNNLMSTAGNLGGMALMAYGGKK